MPVIHRFGFSIVVLLSCLMAGCAGESRLLVDTLKVAFSDSAVDITKTQTLNPAFRYLRLTIEGRPVLLVLGFLDKHPQTGQIIETWYSGQREVLRLSNGRIVSTAGMPVDWQAVRYTNLPAWTRGLFDASTSITFSRERDLDKTYSFGIAENVEQQLQKLPNSQSQPKGFFLTGMKTANLVWIEERYRPSLGGIGELPSSWFALDEDSRVVYSRQCLSAHLCLHLQPWSIEDQTALKAQGAKVDRPQ